jgi:protein-tyrosine-phosphatase
VDLCASLGIDLSGHRSACIAADDVKWADLIVVMDRHNWHALVKLGTPAEKVAWAGAMTPGPLEIPDPYSVSNRDLEAVVLRLIEVGERLSSKLSPAARCDALQ